MVLSVDAQIYQDHCKEFKRLLSGAREKYFTDQGNSVVGDYRSSLESLSHFLVRDQNKFYQTTYPLRSYVKGSVNSSLTKSSKSGTILKKSTLPAAPVLVHLFSDRFSLASLQLHSHNLYHSPRQRCINLSQGAQPSHMRQIHSRHGYSRIA